MIYETQPGVSWWRPSDDTDEETDKRQRALALMSETSSIEGRQSAWHSMGLWNGTLYSNRELPGFHWGVTRYGEAELTPANLITENLVQSIGDSMLAKASSSPLVPTPVARGASFKTRKLIRKLKRWLYGTWRQLKCEDLAVRAFLDAYICGTGVVRLDYAAGELCAESVFFDNLIVDNREGLNRAPARTYRLRSVVPRNAVEAHYNVHIDQQDYSYVDYREVGSDYIVLIEAWKMPIGEVGTEGYVCGRHCVAAHNMLVLDEEWELPYPPLLILRWQDQVSGFYSPSGVEQVVPYQIRLNEINERIREAQDITVNPRLLTHITSRVDVNQIDNVPGRLITWTGGVEPKPLIWTAIPGEFYNERERVVKSCFEFFGISQMSAQSQLPPGVRLDSSEAVREFRMQEDTRFLRLWQRFEDFRMDIAKRMIDLMTTGKGRDHVTQWHSGGKAKVETIKWTDIKALTKDMFSWSMDPLPLSSMTPAARADTLQTWSNQGLIGPDERRQLTDAPDLERIQDLEMASIRDIHRHLELMEDGGFEPPDATTNLLYGVPKVTYNIADLKEHDEYKDNDPFMMDVIENHHEWLRVALSLQNPVVNDPTLQAPGPGPAMGIGGAQMPNNSQGFPGQPFSGSFAKPPAMPVNNGMPAGPMQGAMAPLSH